MQIMVNFITGVAVGIEYVEANEEAMIDYPCLVIDLLVLRIIMEFTG